MKCFCPPGHQALAIKYPPPRSGSRRGPRFPCSGWDDSIPNRFTDLKLDATWGIWARPTGRRDYISHLAWKHPGIPQWGAGEEERLRRGTSGLNFTEPATTVTRLWISGWKRIDGGSLDGNSTLLKLGCIKTSDYFQFILGLLLSGSCSEKK